MAVIHVFVFVFVVSYLIFKNEGPAAVFRDRLCAMNFSNDEKATLECQGKGNIFKQKRGRNHSCPPTDLLFPCPSPSLPPHPRQHRTGPTAGEATNVHGSDRPESRRSASLATISRWVNWTSAGPDSLPGPVGTGSRRPRVP